MRRAQANQKRNNLWLLGAIMHAQGASEPKEKPFNMKYFKYKKQQ
ncbi:hypothetical protein ACXQD6_08955 [Staphylococcus argenteus]